MKLIDFRKSRGLSQEECAKALGLNSKGYISTVENSDTPSRKVALKVWQRFGEKIEPLADASDDELEILARFEGEAA